MTSRYLILNAAMTALVALAVPLQLSAQTYTTFDPPNSISTQTSGITQAGAITGFYLDDSLVFHAFLRAADGSFTSFDAPGAGGGFFLGTFPNSINQPGEIAGSWNDPSFTHGFLRTAKGAIITFDATPTSTFTNVTSMNQGGAITGYWADPGIFPNTNCFLRAHDGNITTFNPPGAITSNALAINNDGVIAGYYLDASAQSHGFLRAADGTFTTIDVPGAGTGGGAFTPFGSLFQGTAANAINQAGTITGLWVDANFLAHGFVRAKDGTLTSFDPPGSVFTFPGAINPAGEIAGYWCDFSTCHGFLRTAEGAITSFDPPGSVFTFETPDNNQVHVGINPAGAITGGYTDTNGASHGFVRTP